MAFARDHSMSPRRHCPTRAGGGCASMYPCDQQIVDLLSCLYLCSDPARLLASSRPGFRRSVGIAIFRMDLGVGSARHFVTFIAPLYLRQATFQLMLFSVQFVRQDRAY